MLVWSILRFARWLPKPLGFVVDAALGSLFLTGGLALAASDGGGLFYLIPALLGAWWLWLTFDEFRDWNWHKRTASDPRLAEKHARWSELAKLRATDRGWEVYTKELLARVELEKAADEVGLKR